MTVHIAHGCFTVIDNAFFKVTPPTTDYSTGEIYKGFFLGSDNELVSRAYGYTEKFSINISTTGMYISFNPLKIKNNINVGKLTHKDFIDVLNGLNCELQKIVEFNLDDSPIHNIELPIDIVVNDSFSTREIWRQLESQYLKPKEVSGGYYFSNSQREYSFYDKSLEVEKKHNTTLPERIFRIELKLKNKKQIEKYLNIKTISEIKALLIYNSLTQLASNAFEKDFKVKVSTLLDSSRESSLILVLKDKYPVGYMDRYCEVTGGVEGVLKTHGNLSGFRSFMKDIGVSPDIRKRQIRKIRALLEIMDNAA